MDGKFQTSFIPKKPVVSAVKARSSGMSFLMVIAVFVFTASLVAAGLVFGGKKLLSSRLEKSKADFKKAEEAFDSVTVETLVRLDKRIESAKNILNKHSAILPVFDYLEENTLKNVRFKDLDLSFSQDSIVELTLEGEAKNFSAVALQSDLFARNKDFKNPIISDVDLTLTGGITFNFNTQIDPAFVLYKNVRVNESAASSAESVESAEQAEESGFLPPSNSGGNSN